MAPSYNPNVRRVGNTKALEDRRQKLKDFPINSMVKWKFGDAAVKVVGHNQADGTVQTANGGNYNPNELELT